MESSINNNNIIGSSTTIKADFETSRDILKTLRLHNKSIVSVSGIDEVGKSTIIRKLRENYPDQIISFAFPTRDIKEEIFTNHNIRIDSYSNFQSVYSYNMMFRKDLYEHLTYMLNFLNNYKILLLDRSIIDHICYFNFDIMKYTETKCMYAFGDPQNKLLMDHRKFEQFYTDILKTQNHYVTIHNMDHEMKTWLNFIDSCINIHVPYEKITEKDEKYNKDELFIVQKIFDQVLQDLGNSQDNRRNRLRYIPIEGLKTDVNDPRNDTYEQVKEYLIAYHDLIDTKKEN